jgi:hypothetical protein
MTIAVWLRFHVGLISLVLNRKLFVNSVPQATTNRVNYLYIDSVHHVNHLRRTTEEGFGLLA